MQIASNKFKDINEETSKAVDELAKDILPAFNAMTNLIEAQYGGKTPKLDHTDSLMQEASLEQIRLICRLLRKR